MRNAPPPADAAREEDLSLQISLRAAGITRYAKIAGERLSSAVGRFQLRELVLSGDNRGIAVNDVCVVLKGYTRRIPLWEALLMCADWKIMGGRGISWVRWCCSVIIE